MKHKKEIPPATQRQQGGSKRESGSAARQREYRTKTSKSQAVSVPGTALEAFLKRYRNDLVALPFTSHISRLVDCADFLLDEVKRGRS